MIVFITFKLGDLMNRSMVHVCIVAYSIGTTIVRLFMSSSKSVLPNFHSITLAASIVQSIAYTIVLLIIHVCVSYM